MKKIRVGIDAQAIGTNFSGNEIYIKNVIQNLSSAEQFEYVLFVNKNYNYAGDFTHSDYRLNQFKTRSPFLRLPFEFPFRISTEKLDVLHVQYTAPLFASCPVVTTIHDISFEHYPEYFTKKERAFLKVGVRQTAKSAAKIITVSEYSKRDIMETYKIPEDKVKVTYNSIDQSFRVIDDKRQLENVAAKYGIGGDYILAVGNLQPRKNIPRLLQAYRRLREDHPDITAKLVVVGRKAWLYESIFEELKGFRYVDDVILTDYVPKEDLPLLYNAAKLFVYPSIFEGFGLPVLESMACGTPVITSKTSCLPEIAGNAAVLVDPFQVEDIAEAMSRLLSSNTKLIEHSTKGLLRAQEFSWEKTGRQTMDIYRSVV